MHSRESTGMQKKWEKDGEKTEYVTNSSGKCSVLLLDLSAVYREDVSLGSFRFQKALPINRLFVNF